MVHFSRGDQVLEEEEEPEAFFPWLLLFLPASAHGVPMLSLPAFPRYMVDAADQEKIEASKNELHNLLDKPQLQGIPVSNGGVDGRGSGPEVLGEMAPCRHAPCPCPNPFWLLF